MCYKFRVGHFEAIRMAPNVHTPGKAVALPPPFLFGAALLVSVTSRTARSAGTSPARAVSVAASAVLAAVGVALSAIVTWLFLRARTPISPSA